MIDAGGGLRLRRMRDAAADYERFARWRNTPHVREWWDPDHPPCTAAGAEREYGAAIRDGGPDHMAFIEVDGVPVGFVQWYPWSACADELAAMDLRLPAGAWGLDLFIAEEAWLSRGIGSRTVRAVCDHLLSRGATAVAFGVERGNLRAERAYLRAGMTPQGEYLDLDTRGGERVWCVLMMRTA